LGLKLVDLLEVLFNAAVVVFFLHERDGAEISAAAEVLLTFGGEVDCGNNVIDVHRFNTAADVFYHVWGQLVKSVFSVHLKHAQVTVNLAVHVKNVLAIYGAAISFIYDHCVCCDATAQISIGDGVVMDLTLLEYFGQ
jgi:hypothetical protein